MVQDSSASNTTQVAGGAAPAGAVAPSDTKLGVIGQVAWLMMSSPIHKHLFLTDLEWLVIPPVISGQFRLWRRGEIPVGFISWAKLSDEAEARLKAGARKISPPDWQSGPHTWIMDVIVPFGGQDEAINELRNGPFKGQRVKMLKPAPGGGVAVTEF